MGTQRGLIRNGYKGLIGEVIDYAGEHNLVSLAGPYDLPAVGRLRTRGRIIGRDLNTLNSALLEILNIAKENGYKEIIEIIEETEYKCGPEN